nr:MAG TPA: hypothetical protein [Caudoviricetes sp.]
MYSIFCRIEVRENRHILPAYNIIDYRRILWLRQ